MQQEHTGHIGDPSYLAYTGLGCRHPSCYAAYREYRERLAERKLAGTFKDLRRKEHRAQQILESLRNDPQLAGQIIPVLAGMVVQEPAADERNVQAEPHNEPAPAPAPPAAQMPLQGLEAGIPLEHRDKILAYLRRHMDASGHVSNGITVLAVATYTTGLSPDAARAAVRALVDSGAVRVDGSGQNLWVVDEAAA